MEYVLTEAGNIKIGAAGKPLVKDGDKEFEVDAIGANEKITSLVTESNDRRKKIGDLTTEIDALKATNGELTTKVDSIDDKNKVEIETLTNNINKIWEEKAQTWETEKKELNGSLFNATTGAKFATSKVAAKLVLPPDIALATFGKSFKPDGTAVDSAGNVLLSRENAGKPAEFDEALSMLIDAYPNKDAILKSEAGGGGGHTAGGGNGGSGEDLSAKDNIKEGLAALSK